MFFLPKFHKNEKSLQPIVRVHTVNCFAHLVVLYIYCSCIVANTATVTVILLSSKNIQYCITVTLAGPESGWLWQKFKIASSKQNFSRFYIPASGAKTTMYPGSDF